MKRSPAGLRAITFDVGGTLLEPWPSVGHVYAEVATGFGMTGIAPEALNQRFRHAWKGRGAFDYSRMSWESLVHITFAGLWPEPPSAACFEAIYERFGRAAAWQVFAEVRPALAALRKLGLKLGVISNWDERLRPLLDELHLAQCFDAIVVSSEVGCTKPGRTIFERAAARLEVSAGEILHVGDSALEDVAGANAAGFQSLLLERYGTGGTGASECGQEVVRRLDDLQSIPDRHVPSLKG